MVVYPEAVWYGNVRPEDAAEIVAEHLVGGRPVERLRLADECVNTKSCPHRKAEAVIRGSGRWLWLGTICSLFPFHVSGAVGRLRATEREMCTDRGPMRYSDC